MTERDGVAMRLHPGETEATGWRATTVPALVQLLRDASPGVTGRPRIVAIDGRGGAGKTTLAGLLHEAVPRSAVLHTDDVAWNHACFDWGAVLLDNILKPLHRGTAVSFRPEPWITHDRPGAITVPAGTEVVWVEGTGVIRAELAPWLDASVWVQGDLDAQERRLTDRDGDSPEQRAHVAGWLREELPFLLREQPWARATVVVAGTARLGRDPYTDVVIAPPVVP